MRIGLGGQIFVGELGRRERAELFLCGDEREGRSKKVCVNKTRIIQVGSYIHVRAYYRLFRSRE